MAEPTGPDLRVVYLAESLRKLRTWGTSVDSERRKRLMEAVNVIRSRLATDPLVWGEPSTRYHYLELVVCNGFELRIQMRYAVDEARRIVYVLWFRLLPGNPLEPASDTP